jgi:hypothetical protein
MDKPFIYLFILTRIKEHIDTDIVNKDYIKERITTTIKVRNGGLPRFMVKYIIDDMVRFGIIESINNRDLYRLLKHKEERRINALT